MPSHRSARKPQSTPAVAPGAPAAARQRRAARYARPSLSRLLARLLAAWLAGSGSWLALAQAVPPPLAATALPSGGQLVVGSASITQGGTQMVVQQSSARLGIDWQSFNIGSGASVEFRQPDASSVALNRVLGNEVSQIYGRLSANGQVFLSNPNGVLFAPGAKVDVGGLVASTLDLSQQDFAAGRYTFSGNGAGEVANRGELRASAGGYLVLLGQRVDNAGEISVPAGQVVLASGRAATVSISGSGLLSAVIEPGSTAGSVINSGQIAADGGSVRLSAHSAQALAGSLVNNTGLVRANSIVARNGEIWITGDDVRTSGQLAADGDGTRSGGRISVLGDMQRGSATIGGTLSARGGAQGGEIDTSAARVAIDDATRVSTLATSGHHGQWVIDPTDFTVSAGSGASTTSGIGATTLGTNLDQGNVTLATAATGTEPGDIHVNAAVSWSGNTRLTLSAHRHVNINAAITATGNTAGLTLTPGSGGTYRLNNGAKVTLSGSTPGLTIAGASYTVVNTLAALQGIGANNTAMTGNWALGSDIDATATAGWNSGAGFQPIGDYQPNTYLYFRGRFDGLGHSITGLTINRPAQNYVGLFGYVSNGSIRNLELIGGSVVGGSYVGAVAGYLDGSSGISDVRTGAAVTGLEPTSSTLYVGGVVGISYGSAGLARVHSTGNVFMHGSGGYVGGIAGYQVTGPLSASSASGQVLAVGSSNNTYTGGLVGLFTGTTVADSTASGNVIGTYMIGGLVGYYAGSGGLANSSASGQVQSSGSTSTVFIGGLVGYQTGGGVGTSFASGNVTSSSTSSYAGGLIGYFSGNGNVDDSFASGNVSGGTSVGGLVGYFSNSSTGGRIANSRATGNVTSLASAGGLVGEYYDSSAQANAGIRSSWASGNVSGNTYVGGLIGRTHTYDGIHDSYASGTVTAGRTNTTQYAGGLVGYLYNYSSTGAAVLRSYATGGVTLATGVTYSSGQAVYLGGLVGYADGASATTASLVDSYASGSVSSHQVAANIRAGGLVGYLDVGINRSYANGTLGFASGQAGTRGGLVAQKSSTATASASYWDSAATGQATSATGTALGAAAARQQASYVGWDMTGTAGQGQTWRIYEGLSTPLLSQFLTPLTLTLGNASKVYDGTQSFGGTALANSLGVPVANPERVLLSLAAADAGSYGVGAAQVWSTQNGYDIAVSGTATLTVTPRPLTLSGAVANKVYDGSTVATLTATGAPAGLVAGEDLAVNTSAVTAAFANKNAGSGKTVTVSGYALADGVRGKASNYSLANATSTTADITPAPATVGGFSATARAYDGSTSVAVALTQSPSIGGLIGADSVGVSVGSVAGSLADKNAGSGKAVTVSGVALTGTDAANYRIDGIAALTVDITPRQLTANGITATNKVYDGGTSVTLNATNATLNGAVAGDSVLLRTTGLTGTASDRNAGSAKTVTVTGLSLVGLDAANYTPLAGAVTVDITPRTTTVYAYNSNNEVNKVYNGNTTANATIYSDYNVDGNNLVVNRTSITYADKNVGSGKTITVGGISLTGSAAGNYTLLNTSATTTGNITAKPLTVTGVVATNRPYDGTRDISVDVSSAAVDTSGVVAGDAVTVVLPGTGTVTGQTLNKNAGNAKAVTIPGFSLSGTDAGNYSLTGTGGVTVNIARKNLTATYTGVDKVYDGNNYAQVVSTSSDIVAGDTVSFYSNLFTGGSFSGTNTFTGTSTPGQRGQDVGSGKTISISYNDLRGTDAANYTLVNATGSTTASITAKGVTLVYNGVNKVYDGSDTANVTPNLSASGIASGDAVALTQTALYTGANARNVGTAKPISISNIAFSGANAANYTLNATTASASASITPKPITLTGISTVGRVYDGSTVVGLTVGTLGASGVVGGDVVTVTPPGGGVSTGSVASKTAGIDKAVTVAGFTLSGADAGNYSVDSNSGLRVTITPRPLTATFTGVSRVYNGGVGATVTGNSTDIVTVGGVRDSVTFAQTATYVGSGAKDVGTAKPVNVSSATLAGADAANYTLLNTTASTTADITPRAITVSYSGVNRVYNGLADTSATVLGSSSQLVAGDAVIFTQTAQFQGNGAVGVSKTIDITGIGLSGANAANYSLLNASASTSASILPKPVAVSGVSTTNRAYDGSNVVAVNVTGVAVNSADIVAGDTLGITGPGIGATTGTMADTPGSRGKDVGVAKMVTVAGLSLTGASAANYTLSGAGISVNITPRPLTAVWAGVNKVYDGSVSAAVAATSSDIVAGDAGNLGFGAVASFTGSGARNVGTGKAITIGGGFLTGNERNNYTLLNTSGSATADITPKTLSTAWSGGTRVYDGTVAAPVTGSTIGVVAGDTVGLTQTAEFTGAGARNVGNNKAVAVSGIALSGADAGNYTLASASATTSASITRKPITVTGLTGISAVDRVYDGSAVVTVNVSITGPVTPNSNDIIAGDDVTVTVPPNGPTTGTMANKLAGANKAVVVSGLLLGGADAANYSVAGTEGVLVNIARKPVTASYSGVSKEYDGSVAATVTGTTADRVAGDVLSIAGSGVYTGSGAKNAGNGKAIDVLSASLQGADAPNYLLQNTTGSTTGTITRRLVTATYSGGSKVYDGTVAAAAAVTGSASRFIAGDAVSLTQSAVFTGTGAKNVGENKTISVTGINLAGTDAANYTLSSSTAGSTGNITRRPIGIIGLTGISAADRVYDGTRDVQVTVTGVGTVTPNPADLIGGDDITVSVPSPGTTTGTVANKNAGSAKTVTVAGFGLSGTDAANYTIAAASGVTVNITPRTISASYIGVTRVYDGSAAATVSGSSANLIAGDSITISGSGTYTGAGAKNVGTGKAIEVLSALLGGTDAVNYSLSNPTGSATGSITPRSVSASYTGGTRVYDGTVAAPVTGSASGFIAGDSVSLSETAVFTGTGARNVGSNKLIDISGIMLAGLDAANYSLLATSASTSGGITPRPLSISGLSGISAASRVYDGTNVVAVNITSIGPATPNPADLIGGDIVTVSVPGTGTTTGTLADKHVGSAKAVVVTGLVLGGADAGNYRIAGTDGVTVNITQRQVTASYGGASKVYDGLATIGVNGSSGDIIAGDALTIVGSGVFSAGKNAGLGKAIVVSGGSLTGADALNYSLLNASANTTGDITPRPLSATYAGGTREYDGSIMAPVTGSLAGLVTGDAVSLAQSAAFIGAGAKNVGAGKAVTISGITLTGTDAANYSLSGSSAGTTASITPKALTITGLTGITATNRVYDGTRDVNISVGSVGTLTGDVIAGDDVTISAPGSGTGAGQMLNKNVGSNKPVVVGGLLLSGADAGNYVVGAAQGVTVNITPLAVQLSGVSAVDRAYDGTRVVAIDSSAGALAGTVAGDDVRVASSGVSGQVADKNAGNARPVTLGGLALAGNDAGNYMLSPGALLVNIAPRLLTLGPSIADRIYDGSNIATPSFSDDRISGDALSVSAAGASYADKNAGNAKPVSVTGLTLAGSDAANYRLGATGLALSGNILRAALTVAAADRGKLYGDTFVFTGTEFLSSGLVAGETIAQATLSSAGAAASAGVSTSPYAITVANAAGGSFDPANYTLSYQAGQLQVQPRPLTVVTNSVVRYADEHNPARFGFSTNVGGLVGGDSIASVLQAAPAGSAGAPGGSVFTLLPSGAVFASGSAGNYALRYEGGLLVVLPKPPRVDDIDANAGAGGNIGFAVALSPAELKAALDELNQAAGIAGQPAHALPGAGNGNSAADMAAARRLPAAEAEAIASQITLELAGGGARIAQPTLLRMPLISFDAQLRRLVFGAEAPPSTR